MKASVIVLVALAATMVMRKRSAAVRHWILSAAIVCAAAMPALELVVPSWHIALGSAPVSARQPPVWRFPAAPVTRPAIASTAADSESSSPARAAASNPAVETSVTSLLTAVWIAGFSVSVGFLMIGLGRLAWLASRSRRVTGGPWVEIAAEISRRYGIARTVVLLQSDHPSLLVTWGVWHPRILLPRGAGAWPADRIRVVLSHELAHIDRGDWLMQMTAELLRSAYWFNPLLWIAGRRLRQESEHACDDAVLNLLGVDGSEYATHLLDLAREAIRHRTRWSPSLPAPAIARPSSLERRVIAMLNAHLNRTPITRAARLWGLIGLLAVTIPIAGFAQTSFVTFSGTVVDPNGRIIPGVELMLSDTERDAKRQVKTDANGRFEFVGVPVGEYALDTTFAGFMPVRERVMLSDAVVQKSYALEVGTLQETITVVSDGEASSANRPAPRSAAMPRPVPLSYDPCSASPVGGCLRPPTKLADFRPVYPPHLSDARVQGVVLLMARIGADGSVTRVQLQDPADPIDPALAQSAIAAVYQWQFTPTQLGGVPIETDMKVTVNFVIRQ
jgi:TonB family protein